MIKSESESQRQAILKPLIGKFEESSTAARRVSLPYLARASKRLGHLLMKNGDVHSEDLRQALNQQQEHGGLLGRILLQMGACTIHAITRALLHQSPVITKENEDADEQLENPGNGLKLATEPMRTVLVLAASDIVCLILAGLCGLGVGALCGANIQIHQYLQLWPLTALFLLFFSAWHLYPLVALSPAEELRRTSIGITAVTLSITAVTFLFRADEKYSRIAALAAWALALFLVPFGRSMMRGLFAHKKWWGHPVLVLGAGKTGRMLVRTLQRRPGLGLKPVALLDDNLEAHGTVEAVPVVGGLALAPELARQLNIQYALIAMPSVPPSQLLELIEHYGSAFSHLHVIPDLFGFSSLGVPTKDFGGVLGLEVRQQLLLPLPCFVKRTMDILFAFTGGLCILPLLIILAILIKLDSPGSAFYIQRRLGKEGRGFNAFKFRTMHGDGEARLAELLRSSPELQREYETFHKLKNDPRITRFGRFLRKYSLDEFPQLWNVLRGEMSLVGPRPYLEREIPEMVDKQDVILKALPGMTGMWQVNGRNRALFSERLEMDVDYVRNWSPWLDIHLLARTFTVVLSGSGS